MSKSIFLCCRDVLLLMQSQCISKHQDASQDQPWGGCQVSAPAGQWKETISNSKKLQISNEWTVKFQGFQVGIPNMWMLWKTENILIFSYLFPQMLFFNFYFERYLLIKMVLILYCFHNRLFNRLKATEMYYFVVLEV